MSNVIFEGATVLINLSHRSHFDAYQLLPYLDMNYIFLSLRRPAENSRNITNHFGLKAQFIDAISSQLNESAGDYPSILNPEDMDELLGKLETELSKASPHKAIIIDSLDILSRYYDKTQLLSLIRFIAQRTKEFGMTTFLLNRYEDINQKSLLKISDICTEVINLPDYE